MNTGINRLMFRSKGSDGQIILHADGTVQVIVPPAVRAELDELAESAQASVLKWGTSLVVGFAALGGILHLHNRRTASGTMLALSGASGLLARRAKHEAARWPRQAFAPVPASDVTITPDSSGKLTVRLRLAPPAPPYTLSLAPGEFDPAEAIAFAAAVRGQ